MFFEDKDTRTVVKHGIKFKYILFKKNINKNNKYKIYNLKKIFKY